MAEPTEQENIDAGMERLEELADSFDEELVERAGAAAFADRARRQPWLLAGVSDGMGLHVTVAAIEAGLMDQGVGVYYEPPALLKMDDDGNPVSPVHWARYQNALALEEFAEERGVDLTVLSSDILLAPQRGLKGDVKGDVPEFPQHVRDVFEEVRAEAPKSDAIFIDSVAFGKWISPREGEEPVEVPNVDFQGRIVSSEPKQYHPRGYQETLDTMGRNHGRLLEKFREFGWLGGDALTAFFTWAGGSQNVEVLEGIYGRGSLGDAKILAERDVVEFRLEHGLELGEHAIVRLPAFLSAALMAIPGGGLFGLVSRKTLQHYGVHRDIPELAARMLRRLFGTEWVRENPIAQVELDANESLYMSEISSRVEDAHREIEAYRREQPEEERDEPIPPEKSAELLEGYVPWNYQSVLGRFRPGEDSGETEAEYQVEETESPFRDHLRAPFAAATAAAYRRVVSLDESPEAGAKTVRDRFESDAGEAADAFAADSRADRVLRGHVRAERGTGTDERRIERTIHSADGELGTGVTTVSAEPAELDVPEWLGEPAGSALEGAETLSESTFAGEDTDGPLLRAISVVGFAEAEVLSSGRARGLEGRVEWTVNLAALADVEERLQTYTRRIDDRLVATVVDAGGTPVARLAF